MKIYLGSGDYIYLAVTPPGSLYTHPEPNIPPN
jgi:hypothetical protein